MQISRRLMAVSGMVTAGCRLADVGTDHADIPIYLVREGKIPHAIAMDVNRGPLLRAQENIRQYGLQDCIETRLSDGLRELAPGEADSVLIAGMGGLLIVRILKEGKTALSGCRELILQPQSELRSVRAYLQEEDYEITQEDLIFEDGKYYPMMRAAKRERANAGEDEAEDAIEAELALRYGPILLKRRHPLLGAYLMRDEELTCRVLESLKGKDTEAAKKRCMELEQDLRLLRGAMEVCGQSAHEAR